LQWVEESMSVFHLWYVALDLTQWDAFALHYGSRTFVLGSFEINDLCSEQRISLVFAVDTTTLKFHFRPCKGEITLSYDNTNIACTHFSKDMH